MVDHKKLYRIFQLISRLRSPFGSTKVSLARDFDVTIRTIERYLVLLKELGFEVVKKGDVFTIPRIDKNQIKPEELIVFSLEEAAAIRDGIVNSPTHGPLQKSILAKLYALTDIDEISETIYRQSVTKNVSAIRKAIKAKEQIVLKSYNSLKSNRESDRLVEPIKLFNYYIYLLAYELESQMVKQFKIDRIGDVEITGKPWCYEKKHQAKRIDIFGMNGTEPIEVVLRISPRAQQIMIEEFPDSALCIKEEEGNCLFRGNVFAYEGIGRFIMGLLDEIEIIEPKGLKNYVARKVRGWLNRKK